MIVGILSDTHGRTDATKAGVRLLVEKGAEFLIHCGDVGSDGVLDQLTGIPSAFVFGNVDFDRRELAKYAELLGIRCLGSLGELELGGKRFAVTHGDDSMLVRRVLDAQQHDYLLVGHTHVRKDSRARRTRIINPGALYRAATKTVAVLDISRDQLTFLPVEL
jgi:putative phosphoesterase